MSKTISSLNVILGATVASFVNAFKSADAPVNTLVSSLERVGSTITRLTGITFAFHALEGLFDKVLSIPANAFAAAERQSDAETKLEAVLRATGNAAGLSAEAMNAHAAALQSTTTFSRAAITEFQGVLATFQGVSGPVFQRATSLALDMSGVFGGDLTAAAMHLGRALTNPTEGLMALRRVGITFTAQQRSQIKSMEDAGDIAGAQAVILNALQGKFSGVAEAMAKTPFGRFKQIGNEITEMSEKIGNILAAIGSGFAQAFNISGAIGKFSAYLEGSQSIVEKAVSEYAPIVVHAVGSIYDTIVRVFDSVYGVVAPVVSSVYTVFSGVFSGIESLVANHTSGIIGALAGVAAVITGPLVLGAIGAIGAAVITVAGIIASPIGAIVAAFGAIGAAIGMDGIESAMSFIANAVDVTANFVSTRWNAIAAATASAFDAVLSTAHTVWSAVYGFVAPIVAGIYDFVAKNLQGVFESVVGVFGGIYDVIAAGLGAAWDLVSAVWTGISATFKWGADLIGLTSVNAGDKVTGAFQGMVNYIKEFADGASALMMMAGYAISHFSDTFILVGTEVELAVVRMGNQIYYVFSDVIPGVLSWLGNNWAKILTDMANLEVTVFENMAGNAVKVFKNLPGLISGSTKFDDIWTPLTDGFKATLTEMPRIAERQAGPVEKSLQQQADRAAQSYTQGLGQYMAEHMARDSKVAKALEGTVSGAVAALKTPAIPAPTFKIPEVPQPKPMKLDTAGATKPLNALADSMALAKAEAQSLDAVLAGSADSLKLQYAGMMMAKMPSIGAAPAPMADASTVPSAGAATDMLTGPKTAGLQPDGSWLTTAKAASLSIESITPPGTVIPPAPQVTPAPNPFIAPSGKSVDDFYPVARPGEGPEESEVANMIAQPSIAPVSQQMVETVSAPESGASASSGSSGLRDILNFSNQQVAQIINLLKASNSTAAAPQIVSI